MQVSVKLFGALRQFLPAGGSFNSCDLNVAENASVADVLAQLPIPGHKPYLVIVNDVKLDSGKHAETPVSAADEIVLLPPIKGG